MCHSPPPPRGSSVVRPSQFQEPSSQANAPLLSSSGSINHGNNTQRSTTNLNSSDSRRNNNSNRNSTSGRNATTNPTLCDPCAYITIIQQPCIPADAVIHPWTDGQFQAVDHKINPIDWISLNLSVGKIVHTMPKVGICTHLPFPLILGLDWQQQVQARCTYDSNGALCFSTPISLRLYECINASKPSINCIASNEVSLPPLEDVVLPDLSTKILPSQAQLIPKFAKLSTIQQAQLDAAIGKFSDVFYSDDDYIGLCPYIEFKIDFQYEKPIRCRPYRLSEPDRQFLNMQIQKWLKQGISCPSNSTYAAPAFIVEQPFHESTPRRVVIDYSRTINSVTKLDPHPIDHMEDVIKRIVGKCYISKMDVKSACSTIRIRETDIFKTGTTQCKYIDDISTSHDDFSYHLKVLYKILEATRNAGFKLTPGKPQLAESEIALFGRIFSQDGERPDPDHTASVQRYSTLKSIHEARSFLGFSNQFRKHVQNYAVIAKPLTSVLKSLERKISYATIILTDDQQRTFENLKTAITTAPILAYFKQGLPTFLETNTSYSGLGAVLSQDQNGKRRVI
ncbi:retrovirus-related Pol polyprotein from transposon opus [Trichonephila clavipes]|uniref:Retrovirus-related Pol polyprotein from transposon opus n=1 Tax=Trichonephila clavipes TaxID=2585209 RepID=A0A8X6WA88_TRICX|nr:retrovirus-related Pol polyprotein from transposon opus [Trichonephila clavipes]